MISLPHESLDATDSRLREPYSSLVFHWEHWPMSPALALELFRQLQHHLRRELYGIILANIAVLFMIGPKNWLSRIFRDLERSNKYVLLLRG